MSSPDPLSSDDSGAFDFFPSSPISHIDRFTSPYPEECLNAPIGSRQHTLPLEIIDYIIELYCKRYCFKSSFHALRQLSEVNSQFRLMAMRHFMTSLSICSSKQLTSLAKVHISMISKSNLSRGCMGFHWVKHLFASSEDLARAPWKPGLLSRLRDLHISFSTEVRSTQHMRAKQIFTGSLADTPMTHLTSLTLTDLWRIDPRLLGMVSEAFPGLTSLHLSCSEHLDMSCCWTCLEDSSAAVVHSPIPNHFRTVAALTNAFVNALKSLTKLTDLHLGIFLSNEETFEAHIDHYDSPGAYSHMLLSTLGQTGQNHPMTHPHMIASQSESPSTPPRDDIAYTPDEDNTSIAPVCPEDPPPPFPHGPEMCPTCSRMCSGAEVRTRELTASLAIARKLTSVRTVGWSSFFSWQPPEEDEKKVGDWKRMTKVYVHREGGRIRVRRRPWA